jgi:two-component system sensor histidine kinase QseC
VAHGATGDAERAHALDQVMLGCDRAARLIEQFLTLARVEQDGLVTTRAAHDLRDIIGAAVTAGTPAAVAKHIDIVCDEGDPVIIAGDRELLEILFRNLLENAVRYSRPETVVRTTASSVDGQAVATVADEGPGVPAADRHELGRRFYRALGTGQSGSGLGLSISRRIAALHDATLAFGPVVDGPGLEVTVTFRNASRG